MAPYVSVEVADSYEYLEVPDLDQNLDPKPEIVDNPVTTATASYFIFLGSILCIWLIVFLVVKLLGQKSRDPQQTPRMYVSSARNRTSLTAQAPSIYITPANMPPPKYEAMAPPSYDEVVGIHYPQYASTATQPAPAQTAAQPPPGYDTASTTVVPAVVPAVPVTVRSVPAETTISISS